MNKRNKILVGCLALLLVLSVGYALFSETITINGTATAKGSFDITITVPDNYYELTGDLKNGEYGIVTDSNITINGDIITASATLGAPGSGKQILLKVENTGTIPARLKSVTDENGNEPPILTNWYGKKLCQADGVSCIYVEIFPDMNYEFDYSEWDYAQADGGPNEELLYQAVLDPGESTYYFIHFYWGKNSISQEEMSLDYTFKLNWEQVTN